MNFKCDTPDNIKRAFGSGFRFQINATSSMAQQLFQNEKSETAIQQLMQRKVRDVNIYETTFDQNQERRNIEVFVPHSNARDIPAYLEDFI